MLRYRRGELLYQNPLKSQEDTAEFVMEGNGIVEFPEGKMRLKTLMREDITDDSQQKTNIVFWCNQEFPSDIVIEFNYLPVYEPGLCILFFSAKGRNGEDLFAPGLKKRTGDYSQYYDGDINCFHLSYFRRKYDTERHFHVCNLRKSHGGHIVCQAPNPIPETGSCMKPYHITLVKCENEVAFYIDELPIFCWQDDGATFGGLLGGGKIGFRQMSPGIFEYSDLEVHRASICKEYLNTPCTVKY